MATPIRRRQFTRLASLGIASAMLPSGVTASNKEKVLVVGAGLAGLQAALVLQQRGVNVQVLEGRPRVGGRLYTLDSLPGHPEGGGNTIGGTYGRLIARAHKLNVELLPQRGIEPLAYVINGEPLHAEQWSESSHNTLPDALRQPPYSRDDLV